jgi:hypothetical protein
MSYVPGWSRCRWSLAKERWLVERRGISFVDVVSALQQGRLLDLREHERPDRYPGQRIAIVAIRGYAYVVPFVEAEGSLFLKTVFPSRRDTRRYLRTDKLDA